MRLLAQQSGVEGPRIVVFNPLPWKQSGAVEVKAPGEWKAVRDLNSGRLTKVAVTQDSGLRFFARDIAPNGYTTFKLGPAGDIAKGAAAQATRRTVIQNRFFRL
ncbi:MAG TPA: hypothetical protein VNZ64_11925 [Candidatus Acidoferrum sp.]|jgi:hypothetical protein|nr:hypothetical protein [Candidatus Acidoferrum sp.]